MAVLKNFGDIIQHVYRITNPGDGAITVNAYGSLGTRGLLWGFNEIPETRKGIGPLVLMPKSGQNVVVEYVASSALDYGKTYDARARVANATTGDILDEEVIQDAVTMHAVLIPGGAEISGYLVR